ncbi:MAG: hypothetical protein R8K50_06165 [Mariprofundus sp.]
MGDGQLFSDQEYFSCNKSYKHWHGIFEEYTSITDRYIRVYSDQYATSDAPYWNNERSNVGILAASCWRNGWVALEEYSTIKKKEAKTKGSGRCDLWVSSQSGDGNYAIEAKKGRCSLDSEGLIEKTLSILKVAKEDADKLRKVEGDKRMGLLFMHLYLPKSKGKRIKDLVNKTVSKVHELSETSDVDFIYLYLKDNGVASDNFIIPGVIIAGKSIS